MSKELKYSLCKLFKIIPNENGDTVFSITDFLNVGFIVIDKNGNIVKNINKESFDVIKELYGFDVEKFNMTFHKNFKNVIELENEDYYAEQILHYFSTYGLERMGLNIVPYIPAETLELPKNFNGGKINVIRMLDNVDVVDIVNNYLRTLKAPNSMLMSDIKRILTLATLPTKDILSFEVQILKYDLDNAVLENPITFLRFIVYKFTRSTLLIKSCSEIRSIKASAIYLNENNKGSICLDYFKKIDEESLAKIFYRYKPIFLALKKFNGMPKIINSIRRKAKIYHTPLNEACVQNLNALHKNKKYSDFYAVLNASSTRDIIKCIHSTLSVDNKNKAFSIRNGRVFVRKYKVDSIYKMSYEENAEYSDKSKLDEAKKKLYYKKIQNNELYFIYLNELKVRIAKNFASKVFILPSYMEYTVPYTEKQMVDTIPFGSYVKVGRDPMTMGIAWNNKKYIDRETGKEESMRVDIDFHLMAKGVHLGWNSSRQNDDAIYTGDMTDATNGAAEAFWINNTKNIYVATCNLYSGTLPIDFKFFATTNKPESFNRNYVYDPKTAMFPAINLKFVDTHSINLGVYIDDKFYFYGNSISSGIVPQKNYADFIDALKEKFEMQFYMSDLIKICGGIVVYDSIDEATKEKYKNNEIINLLPENLATDTLMKLVL